MLTTFNFNGKLFKSKPFAIQTHNHEFDGSGVDVALPLVIQHHEKNQTEKKIYTRDDNKISSLFYCCRYFVKLFMVSLRHHHKPSVCFANHTQPLVPFHQSPQSCETVSKNQDRHKKPTQ
jgi:hypothetical protein